MNGRRKNSTKKCKGRKYTRTHISCINCMIKAHFGIIFRSDIKHERKKNNCKKKTLPLFYTYLNHIEMESDSRLLPVDNQLGFRSGLFLILGFSITLRHSRISGNLHFESEHFCTFVINRISHANQLDDIIIARHSFIHLVCGIWVFCRCGLFARFTFGFLHVCLLLLVLLLLLSSSLVFFEVVMPFACKTKPFICVFRLNNSYPAASDKWIWH